MRYFIELSYKGVAYNGWQRQNNAPSIQQTLEDALSTLLRKKTSVTGAGRTDTGVHASYYIAHFDSKPISETEGFTYHLNAILPRDIAIHNITAVADTSHARFDALEREYKYVILTGKDAFRAETAWQYYVPLDEAQMNLAAAALLSADDFTTFSKLHSANKTNLCNVMDARWERCGSELVFTIRADRFLRNMVRSIVGTLVDVGRGKLSVAGFIHALESRDRSLASGSAPAQGLFLNEIIYPDNILQNKILTVMISKVEAEFKKRFGGDPAIYASPGRVNLIGEHTDYNLGFVLPGAIDKSIYVAIKPNGAVNARLYSIDYDTELSINLNGDKPEQQWACYVFGVVQEMRKGGATVEGFDCVFGGDVPLGAGLSSSAALESAFGYALNDLFGSGFSLADLAKIGQMTEHNYVGVRCGIMDQFASLLGEKGKVIRLDCRTLDYELIPFSPEGCKVVLIDSMVKHSLASTQYNVRREQCEAGVAVVVGHQEGVASLRDIPLDMLNKYKDEMDSVVYRRCAYVINENQRLLDGCEALKAGEYALFGEKMYGSHEGLSKEYEVSCAELDFIVEVARQHSGVLGARMMGGGFGGCVISLVKDEAYDDYLADVKSKFNAQYGMVPRVIDVVIGEGARKIK